MKDILIGIAIGYFLSQVLKKNQMLPPGTMPETLPSDTTKNNGTAATIRDNEKNINPGATSVKGIKFNRMVA